MNKLNNIFYVAKENYNNFVSSGIQSFLVKAIINYMEYKKLGGKKVINRLDEFIEKSSN